MSSILRALRRPNLALAAILLFGLLGMTARSATDPDLWWHLRTGQWIVETGHVPHSDPFSFTRAGSAWVSHEWLSDLIFYELWKHGGPAALIVFSAVVTTLGFMLLYLRCPGKRYWAAAATALGAVAAAPSFGVRPQMFTFTFGSLLLWLLERADPERAAIEHSAFEHGDARPELLFWILPLFLLWLNLHAGFALGPALLFAYGVGLLLETALGNTPWREARPILVRVLLLLLACVALVPLNPSGVALYRYPLDTLRSHGMRSIIGEWFSPDFHQTLYRPLLLVWLLLLTALATYRSRPKARILLPLLLTVFAALDAVRHIPIFVLLAMPVIASALPARASFSLSPRALSPSRPGSARLRPLFSAVVIILIAAMAIVKWFTLARHQEASVDQAFPDRAVDFLRSANYPSNIFVYYDWGGYAIWKLYPRYRVFADGRADLYGDDILHQFQTALDLGNGWLDVLNNWKIHIVFVPPSCALAQALLLDPDWQVAFSDAQAVILLRSGPAGGRDLSAEAQPSPYVPRHMP